MRQLILIALLAVSGWGAQRSVYYNSKNAVNGDGSIGNPYKTLALGNTTVTNYISAGDTVTCYLRDRSEFREAWKIPSGGASNPLTITNYGELGVKPVITGGVVATGWNAYASGLGSTWRITLAQTVTGLWVNNVRLTKGSNQDELVNKSWIQTGGVVYLRWDEGNPDGTGDLFERSTMTQVLNMSGLSNINLCNVSIQKANYAIRVTTSASNLKFNNCEFADYPQIISLTATTNTQFNMCRFSDMFGPSAPIIIAGNSSVSFNYCHFKNSSAGFLSFTGGKNEINNCNMDNVRQTVVSSSSSDTTFVNNTLIHGLYPYNLYPLTASNGPIIVNNSLILRNGYSENYWYSGNVVFNNVIKDEPRIVKTSRTGMFSITEDDMIVGSEFKLLADYAKSVDPSFQLSMSMSEVYRISPADSTLYRAISDSGHDVVSHSMSHSYLYPNMGAVTLRYTGTAPACTAIVRNDSLILLTGGIDDRVYKIEKSITKDVAWICNQVDPLPMYACAKTVGANEKLHTFTFKADTLWDIKAAVDSILVDTTKLYPWEFDSSKVQIERITGKPCLEFTYPGGLTDLNQIPFVKRAGYLGARIAGPAPYTMGNNFPLFQIPLHDDPSAPRAILRLDNNTNSALNSTNFTAVNITYNNTLHKEYAGCAVLDGTAYMYRNDNTFTYQEGDYTVGMWVRPSVLNAVNTVFFVGADNSNYLTVYIDSNGAVHYVQMDEGTAVTELVSANGVIPLNEWTRLVFRQTVDTISVFTGTSVPANNRVIYSHTSIKPETYNGTTYLGAGWDFSTSQPVAHFTGYLDKTELGFDIWFTTLCMADQIAMQGVFGTSLGHGDFLCPRDMLKTEIDALAQYTGNLKVIGLGPALQILRANGTFSADSLTISWVQTDSADYRLRSDSKLCNAGDTSVLSGIPNLVNLSGDTLTDASGALKVSSVNIGAYGTLNLDAPPTITVQPQSDSIALGSDVVLSVIATGTAPIAYQWQVKTGTWQDSGNATGITFTVNGPDTGVHTYRVIVSNAFGADTSDSAVITVYWPEFDIDTSIVGSGTIALSPAGLTQDSGTVITATGTAAEGWAGDTSFTFTLVRDTAITFTFLQIPAIDSIRPNPWYYGKVIDIYGAGFGDVQGKLIIDTDTLIMAALWTDTHITDTIPADMSRGFKPVKITNSNNLTGTAQDLLRVLRPYAR